MWFSATTLFGGLFARVDCQCICTEKTKGKSSSKAHKLEKQKLSGIKQPKLKKPKRTEKSSGGHETLKPDAQVALKELVTQIMCPTKPFRLPRPTAPVVHPTLLPTQLLLSSLDADSGIEGVIAVRQDLDNFIEIWTPGAAISVDDGIYGCLARDSDNSMPVLTGFNYSVPGSLRENGVVITASELKDAVGFPSKAWDPDNRRWLDDKVWVFNAGLQAASHSYILEGRTTAGVINPTGSTGHLYALNVVGDQASYVAVVNIALTEGTSSYTDSNGNTLSTHTSFGIEFGSGAELETLRIQVSNVDITYSGSLHLSLPIANGSEFEALRDGSEKYCISAFDSLLTFEGGMTKAGHVSCALLPHGLELPHDADSAIDKLSRIPESRMASHPIYLGAHVSWMPDELGQLWLRERDDQRINSQVIWFAFKGPAPGNLQQAQLRLKVKANVEWENYNPIYGAKSGENCGMLMQAIVDTYGTIQPCSENPKHLKKIAEGVKKVASDPTVRMFANLAVKGGKYILPSLLAMI